MTDDVVFRSGEDAIAGSWYSGGDGRRSCVVMAHGLGATRHSGLEPYVDRFVAAGHHVLTFDYRHFGDSEGLPRQLFDPQRQVADILSALDYVRARTDVDPDRVGLWGASFGGGHVVVVAARDARLAAVISQAPAMDGLTAFIRSLTKPGQSARTLLSATRLALADATSARRHVSPVTVPIVGPPGAVAVMTSPSAEPGYRRLVGEDWVNEVCARLAFTVPSYRPISSVERMSCPWLVQICNRDSEAPVSAVEKAVRKAGTRATVRRYDADHFDIWVGETFERAVADQLAFLKSSLGEPQG